MTILISLGIWSVLVTLTIRFCQHLHACDSDMRALSAGERVLPGRREQKRHMRIGSQPKHYESSSRGRVIRPSTGHSSTAPSLG